MSTMFLRHPKETDLALFAGGELGPLARWRIERHVSACGQCRAIVSEFFELISRSMDLAELPSLDWNQLSLQIQQTLEARRERASLPKLAAAPKSVFLRPAWGLALTMLALIGSGAYLIYRGLPTLAPAVQLQVTASQVELRSPDGEVLTLLNSAGKDTVIQRAGADEVSARYLDADTGNVTINNVYAQ